MLLLGYAVFTPAGTAKAGVLDDVRDGAGVWCEPALKVYCQNIHVGCAGQSTQETRRVSVEPETHGTRFRLRYAPALSNPKDALPVPVMAHGVWDVDGGALTLRPGGAPDYVRILADGSYAERTYKHGLALMAYGKCSVSPNR